MKFWLREEQDVGMSVTVFCGVKCYHLCQGIALYHDPSKKKWGKKYSHPITGLDRPRRIQEDDANRFLESESCQSYALAEFTPQEIFLVLISVRG